MKKPYAEQLRDPRWQKKRLELLEKAEWTCKQCRETSKELQVHHMYYKKGLAPWEYPEDALLVLCKDCHVKVAELQEELAHLIAERCFSYSPRGELEGLANFMYFLPPYPMNRADGTAAAKFLCSLVDWFNAAFNFDDKVRFIMATEPA